MGFNLPVLRRRRAGAGDPYKVEGVRPDLVFDFDGEYYRTSGSTSAFSSAITHTRAGNATMVDSDGVLKWAPHNLLPYSDNLNAGSWIPLGLDPDRITFDSPNSDRRYAALYNALFTAQLNQVTLEATFTVDDGLEVIALGAFHAQGVFGWAAYDTNSQTNLGSYTLSTIGSFSVVECVNVSGNDWRLVVRYLPNRTGVRFLIQAGAAGQSASDLRFAGVGSGSVGVKNMRAYRSDLGGMVDNPDRGDSYVPTTTDAVYLPRRGHHVYNGSAWINEGLLHESEARTNLVTYSSEFDNAAWGKVRASITTGAVESPDGETNASKLVEDSSSSTSHFINETALSLTSGINYTFSFFAKQGERNWVGMQFGGVEFANQTIYFDLSTGVVGTESGTGVKGQIRDVGSGWYRCIGTAPCDTTGSTGQILIFLAESDGVSSYTGDGTSGIYVYGAQFEEGSTPSSYIPTSGATVTRAAETLTVPAANLPWPEPVVIGEELVTNGTFETDTSGWTAHSTGILSQVSGRLRVEAAANFGGAYTSFPTTIGKVYSFSYEAFKGTATSYRVEVGFGPQQVNNYGSGTITAASKSDTVSFVATHNPTFITIRCDNAGAYIEADNISVREIDPLAVSIQMDGRMTFADETSDFGVYLVRWVADGNNLISSSISTFDTTDVDFYTRQVADGTTDISRSGDVYNTGILQPFNIASRHGSTFINGAVDGTALTANTTPTALPDLETTDLTLGYDYMGTIRQFRVWSDDLGDAGIEEASS